MPNSDRTNEDAQLRAILDRIWQHDVRPLLSDRHADQRRTTARLSTRAAVAAGGLLDKALRLRGRPFTRSLAVLGGAGGALLPDLWNWSWWRARDAETQAAIQDRIARRAAELSDEEALRLLDLSPTASAEDARAAWHVIAQRWHPDKATDEADRRERHLRFVIYEQAYRQIQAAHAAGRLPRQA